MGLIERYRERLPFAAEDPVVSLNEGSTPLVLAPRLSERAGVEVWLKLEGANPTGSFKDRGMTCAVSAAVREGAEAVICASTGNTAASAAAYSARAGLRGVVIVPEGKIAAGKLAQALMHGARVVALRGNFDQALKLVRELASRHPVSLVNSVNEFRIEGQKTAAFEVAEALGGDLDALCIPVGNAGNVTAYWRGFREVGCQPRMHGFQAAGAAPLVHGAPVAHPETVASAIRIGNPARWEEAMDAMTSSGGAVKAVSDEQILDAYRFLAAHEGVFCEPASAASVAGLLAYGVPGARAGGVRAHRSRAQGSADRAQPGRRGHPVPAEAGRHRARGAGMTLGRRRLVRVPASSANLGPGFDVLAAALSLHLELEVVETGAFSVISDLDVPADRSNLVVRAFERLHPSDDFEFRISSKIPLSGGLGSSAAAIVAGLMAADHLFELDADVLALASELEGHPDNVAAALEGGLVICEAGRVHRFEPPLGLESVLVVPDERVPTAAARAALPATVSMLDAVYNLSQVATLVRGLCSADWELIAAGLGDRLHQPRRAHLYPRSAALLERVREPDIGALGATISGAGPAVLVWSYYEQTGRVVDALTRETEGWASVIRVPFESQGADVRGI